MPAILRSPIWPDPRLKPPFGAARFNPGHPLAFSYGLLLNEGGPAALWLPAEFAGALTIEGPPTATNSGLTFNGTSDILWWDSSFFSSTGSIPPTGSVFCRFDRWTSTSANTRLVSMGGRSTNNNPLFNINVFSAGILQSFYRDNVAASGTLPAATDTARNDGGRHTVGVVLDGNTTHIIYADGIQRDSQPCTAGGITVDRTAIGGIRRAASGSFMAAQIEIVYFYRRVLTAGEMLWLHAEPYAMFESVVRRRYSIGPPTPPIVTASSPRRLLLMGVGR